MLKLPRLDPADQPIVREIGAIFEPYVESITRSIQQQIKAGEKREQAIVNATTQAEEHIRKALDQMLPERDEESKQPTMAEIARLLQWSMDKSADIQRRVFDHAMDNIEFREQIIEGILEQLSTDIKGILAVSKDMTNDELTGYLKQLVNHEERKKRQDIEDRREKRGVHREEPDIERYHRSLFQKLGDLAGTGFNLVAILSNVITKALGVLGAAGIGLLLAQEMTPKLKEALARLFWESLDAIWNAIKTEPVITPGGFFDRMFQHMEDWIAAWWNRIDEDIRTRAHPIDLGRLFNDTIGWLWGELDRRIREKENVVPGTENLEGSLLRWLEKVDEDIRNREHRIDLSPLLKTLTDAFNSLDPKVRAGIAEVDRAVVGFLGSLWRTVDGVVTNTLGSADAWFVQQAERLFRGIDESVQRGLAGIDEKVVGPIKGMVDSLVGRVSEEWAAGLEGVAGLSTAVGEWLAMFGRRFHEEWTAGLDSLGKLGALVTNVVDNFLVVFSKSWVDALQSAEGLAEKLQGLVKQLWDKLFGWLGRAVDFVLPGGPEPAKPEIIEQAPGIKSEKRSMQNDSLRQKAERLDRTATQPRGRAAPVIATTTTNRSVTNNTTVVRKSRASPSGPLTSSVGGSDRNW